MGEQRHVVKSQVLAIQVADAETGREIADEVARIYRRRIVPLLDRCCTKLSEPDRVHRIESLELDPGSLDPGHLEADLVAGVEARLEPLLASGIAPKAENWPCLSGLHLPLPLCSPNGSSELGRR